MSVRRVFTICGLFLVLAVVGCADTVGGQAEMALPPAASLPVPVTTTAPGTSPNGADRSRMSRGTISAGSSSAIRTSSDRPTDPTRVSTTPVRTTTTGRPETTTQLEPSRTRTTPNTTRPTVPDGIPDLTPECKKVETAITAFGTVFDGAGSADAVISQDNAQAALRQMPTSGLPAQPQDDVAILRAVVAAAGGRTLTQLALSLSDGKATSALEDLASWAAQYCS